MNVSVCMATHNGEKYLRQQIDSILHQLEEHDELIVSDDSSADNTVAILNSYRDHRIMVLQSRKFGTPSKNFEHALTYCHNPLIFLADQDDVWHPDKIRIMREELNTFDLVVCDCQIVDEKLSPIHDSFFDHNGSGSGLLKNFVKNSFVGCCMAFNRKVAIKALPFPDTNFHDQWIGLVAERYFKVRFLPHVLVHHRKHPNNYSSTGQASNSSLARKIRLRLQLAKELLEH